MRERERERDASAISGMVKCSYILRVTHTHDKQTHNVLYVIYAQRAKDGFM